MKTLSIIISIFFTIFIVLFIFTFLTVEKLHAETIITDADIAITEYTILTGMEDGLINSMRVTNKYLWDGDQTDYSKQINVTATVK